MKPYDELSYAERDAIDWFRKQLMGILGHADTAAITRNGEYFYRKLIECAKRVEGEMSDEKACEGTEHLLLPPCPFCGEKAELVNVAPPDPEDENVKRMDVRVFVVRCGRCKARGPWHSYSPMVKGAEGSARNDAISAWNRRAEEGVS